MSEIDKPKKPGRVRTSTEGSCAGCIAFESGDLTCRAQPPKLFVVSATVVGRHKAWGTDGTDGNDVNDKHTNHLESRWPHVSPEDWCMWFENNLRPEPKSER